jgi:hypothetical protein
MSVQVIGVKQGQKYQVDLRDHGRFIFEALATGKVYYSSYMVW